MKQPIINDIMLLIVSDSGGQKEVFGRLKGYRNNDCGEYVVIENGGVEKNIFRPSIVDWKILQTNQQGEI